RRCDQPTSWRAARRLGLAPGQGDHRYQQQRTSYTLNRTNDHLRIVASTRETAYCSFVLFFLLERGSYLVRGQGPRVGDRRE
ncbi:MAG: hypothetical protein ACKVK6_17000, partial [bacterium]